MPRLSLRGKAFAERFPSRLSSLKEKAGYSWYELARRWQVPEGRLTQYRHGTRLPPLHELLELVRLAKEVEGGLDALLQP